MNTSSDHSELSLSVYNNTETNPEIKEFAVTAALITTINVRIQSSQIGHCYVMIALNGTFAPTFTRDEKIRTRSLPFNRFSLLWYANLPRIWIRSSKRGKIQWDEKPNDLYEEISELSANKWPLCLVFPPRSSYFFPPLILFYLFLKIE